MTRRMTRLLALVLVCVTALGWSAGSAQAAKKMEVGLQDDATFLLGLRSPFKGLAKARGIHVRWLRVNVTWAATMKKSVAKRRKPPKKVKYRWRRWDDIIKRAKAKGIKVELTLTGDAPRWATGNRKKVGNYKIKLDPFEHYVRAVIKHFRHKVDRYAIWNEPNFRTWNEPLKGNAERYRKMYSAAYKIIHDKSKKARIFIGETSPYGKKGDSVSPIKFLRRVANKGLLRADGYAHHPYDYKHGPRWPKTPDANAAINNLGNLTDALDNLAKKRRLVDRHGKPLYLYLTEFGYMASGPYKKPASQRAQFLPEAFQIALRNPRVKQMLQYNLAPPPRFGNDFDTSIVTKKGKPTKVFKALEAWTDKQAKAHLIARPPGR